MRFYKPQKGARLPTLTDPAGPPDIVMNKEAINSSGQKLVGKLYISEVFTVDLNGAISLETYDYNDLKVLRFIQSLGNATAADIVKGKTALTDAGAITGTLEATGGEPSYTLQIQTQNPTSGQETIVYYAPGSSEKTTLALNTSLQTITCGGFICLNRTSSANFSSVVYFLDSNGVKLLLVSSHSNPKYLVNGNKIGWNTINIGAVKRDYPNVVQMVVEYMD